MDVQSLVTIERLYKNIASVSETEQDFADTKSGIDNISYLPCFQNLTISPPPNSLRKKDIPHPS